MADTVNPQAFSYIKKQKQSGQPQQVDKAQDKQKIDPSTFAKEPVQEQNKQASNLNKQTFDDLKNLTKGEVRFLREAQKDGLSLLETVDTAVSMKLSHSDRPFILNLEEKQKTAFKSESPVREELFPGSVEQTVSDEELNPESAEYQAAKLGPITSRLKKGKKDDTKIQAAPITPAQAKKFKRLEDLKQEAMNIEEDSDSEFDKQLLSQLPANKQNDDIITGNPKDICPVDLEENEQGEIIPFFNLDKTFANLGHPEWSNSIKVPPEKFESSLWQNIAKKQYTSWQAYTALSEGQKEDKAKKVKKLKLLIPATLGVLILIAGATAIIPRVTMGNGLSELEAGNYQEAYRIFCENGSNRYYCAYTEVQLFVEDNKYEEALEKLDRLSQYQSNVKYDLEETRNEVIYKQGLYYISEKKYAQGLNTLKTIANYKDVPTVYYDTCYRVAEEYAETNKEISLRYFYMANEYKDSKKRFDEMANSLYTDGLANYYSGNYDQAKLDFEALEKFAYKDARTMALQCVYRAGLDAFLDEDYRTSNSYFEQIPEFKDASALYISEEVLQQFMSEDEIAELIKKTGEEHPDWIMSYQHKEYDLKITLYNGEIFNYDLEKVSTSEVDKFIDGHGGKEALKIAMITKNYSSETSLNSTPNLSTHEITEEQFKQLQEEGLYSSPDDPNVTVKPDDGNTIKTPDGKIYTYKSDEPGFVVEKEGE